MILFPSSESEKQKQRRQEVSEADIVVSLLPHTMHVEVAEDCVDLGKDMVTASYNCVGFEHDLMLSYTSERMKALHERAKAAGCVIVNELGLDPGIDHMACMNARSNLHQFYAHL